MKKPFALLVGEKYYASPGWHAYVNSFETLIEAIKQGRAEKEKCGVRWFQVVDLRDLTIVAGGGCAHTGLTGEVQAMEGRL